MENTQTLSILDLEQVNYSVILLRFVRKAEAKITELG